MNSPVSKNIQATQYTKILETAVAAFLIVVRVTWLFSEPDISGIIAKCEVCVVAKPKLAKIKNPEQYIVTDICSSFILRPIGGTKMNGNDARRHTVPIKCHN